jgi:hypothetical protein
MTEILRQTGISRHRLSCRSRCTVPGIGSPNERSGPPGRSSLVHMSFLFGDHSLFARQEPVVALTLLPVFHSSQVHRRRSRTPGIPMPTWLDTRRLCPNLAARRTASSTRRTWFYPAFSGNSHSSPISHQEPPAYAKLWLRASLIGASCSQKLGAPISEVAGAQPGHSCIPGTGALSLTGQDKGPVLGRTGQGL